MNKFQLTLCSFIGLFLLSTPTLSEGKNKPIKGYADLHAHLFVHLAYNGQWYHPAPDARTSKPKWDNIKKQAMQTAWLKKAHRDGLKLIVVSLVNFEPLCNILDTKRRFNPSRKARRKANARTWSKSKSLRDRCSDMKHVWKQLKAARDYEKRHKSWFKIVTSPAEARRTIAQGKLAAVLHIEVSNLMDERYGPWKTQLDKLYKAGVRAMQPVHQLNNRFGGCAFHHNFFKMFEYVKNKKKLGDKGKTSRGFKMDKHKRNRLGLHGKGKELIQEMIRKKMLVDVAHLSQRGISAVYSILKRHNYYPMFVSHTWIHENIVGSIGKKRENPNSKERQWSKDLKREHIDLVMRTGGMIGLRPGAQELRGFIPRRGKAVANTCHGSTRSFAQMYNYVKSLGATVGIGSDLNGFIAMTQPRFGSHACSATYVHCTGSDITEKAKNFVKNKILGKCKAFKAEMHKQRKLQTRRLRTEFDTMGFSHVGVFGDFVKDLQNVGGDIRPIQNSAENFIRMWERAYGKRSNRSLPGAKRNTGRFVRVKGRDDRAKIKDNVAVKTIKTVKKGVKKVKKGVKKGAKKVKKGAKKAWSKTKKFFKRKK
mgnify:CR=1 FL=1